MALFCPSLTHLDSWPWVQKGEIWVGRKLSEFVWKCFQGWMEQCSYTVKVVISDGEDMDTESPDVICDEPMPLALRRLQGLTGMSTRKRPRPMISCWSELLPAE